jgi:hypothetical protein
MDVSDYHYRNLGKVLGGAYAAIPQVKEIIEILRRSTFKVLIYFQILYSCHCYASIVIRYAWRKMIHSRFATS